MPRPVRYIMVWTWGVVLLLALSMDACGSSSSDKVVAKVSGRSITKATFDHWLSIQAGSGSRTAVDQAASQDGDPQQHVMESLISAEWTLAQASELGVSVSEREAQQQLTVLDYAGQAGFGGHQLLPKEAELKRLLSFSGLTHADRAWLVKLTLLTARLEQKARAHAEQQVTHAQAANYYDEHRQRFTAPEEREFMIVLTYSKRKTQKAKREIETGRDFLTVASHVSVDPNAHDNMRRLKRGFPEPDVVAHVFAAKLHTLAGPFRRGFGYYFFKLTKIMPKRQRTLGQVEGSIRHYLVSRESPSKLARLAAARARTWKARTSCSAGYVVPLCRQYASAS